MKARLPIALLTSLLVALPYPTAAEQTSNGSDTDCEVKLSLDSFRAYALAHSPLVAVIDRDYATQVARAIETELLTNPELSGFQTWTRMYVDGANDPQSEVSISQPIRLSNFGKRDKVAELLRKAGDTEKNIKLLEFSQNNTVNYVRLYALQETVRVLQRAEQDAGVKLETVRKHVREGLLSQGSEALFQGEKARLEAQRAGAEAELATIQSELAMGVGTTCKIIASQAPTLGKIATTATLIDKARSSRISERARIEVLQELTNEQTKLARLDAVPMIAPKVVYQHTNDGGDFVGAGITVPLPLWNRNQPEITRVTAERDANQRKTDLIQKGGLELQVTTAHVAATSSQRQVDIYSTSVEPSFRAALQAEERSYLSGKGSVLEVWQTFRALNEALVTGLALRQQAALTRARLSILVGEEV